MGCPRGSPNSSAGALARAAAGRDGHVYYFWDAEVDDAAASVEVAGQAGAKAWTGRPEARSCVPRVHARSVFLELFILVFSLHID